MKISIQDTSVIKGVSILMIILHNLTHFLPNAVKENEYSFDVNNFLLYWEQIKVLDTQVFLNFLSHYGHYGICAFLFISGYGLVKKYESSSNAMPNCTIFLGQQAIKLWRLMIPGLILFALTNYYTYGDFIINKFWTLNMIMFTSNLIPDRNLILGPWWFFSLIMQCYVCYCLIFYRYRSLTLLLTLTISTLLLQVVAYNMDLQISIGGASESLLVYLRYNLLGHLLPFACGIAWARLERDIEGRALSYHLTILLVSIILLCVSSINIYIWFISPIFAITIILSVIRLMSSYKLLYNSLAWIGFLSPFIFATHPIVRNYMVKYVSSYVLSNNYLLVYTWLVIYLMICCLLAWGLYYIDIRIKLPRWLSNKI